MNLHGIKVNRMEPITNLKDLLVEQLRELYDAELQQKELRNLLHEKASSISLRESIEAHSDLNEIQIRRINRVFDAINVATFGEHSDAMEGLITEARKLINRCSDPEVCDATIITAAQYIEHFEIAAGLVAA